MRKEQFGNLPDGTEIFRYTLENDNGLRACVINFGAILSNLYVPDKKGREADVVLGYDTLEQYEKNGSFFGATVGPCANRTAGAAFTLDGVTYRLDANEGCNNLHSHREKGLHKRVWRAEEGENSITFSLHMKEGELGFPGNRTFQVTYRLDKENALSIHYHVRSDRRTYLNLTNHSYFNLTGAARDVLEHQIQILADAYTPVGEGSIPTGEIAPVAGTPMDLRTARQVGLEIDGDFEQLRRTGGYDHNWVTNGFDGQVRRIASVMEPVSGRNMQVETDLPGVQFYTGNFIGHEVGKGGIRYGAHYGLCLETQFFPNTANEPSFPQAFFGPDREYDSTTVYRFY